MKLTAFDLDGTLVVGNTSFSFCSHLVRRKVLPFTSLFLSPVHYLRHRYLGRSIDALHEALFSRYLIGMPIDSLKKQIPEFLDHFLYKSLYTPALSRLEQAREKGHYTLLLSNSPFFLVEPIAERLGFHEWGATLYASDADEKLSSVSYVLRGERKAEVIRRKATQFGIEKNEITAYSDSYLDLPFLEAAGVAVAVRPDRKLRKICRLYSWEVL